MGQCGKTVVFIINIKKYCSSKVEKWPKDKDKQYSHTHTYTQIQIAKLYKWYLTLIEIKKHESRWNCFLL